MNYSPDTCMTNFTEEQARRMRCTLEFYRPDLGEPTGPVLGLNYCVLTPNSTGSAAFLTGFGTKQLGANDFGLIASALPSNVFGFFITSTTQAVVTNPGGSAGTLCVGGNVGRYIDQISNSGIFGEIFLNVDTAAMPQPNGFIPAQAGQTWNFQAWFRDGASSNFTDGYTIIFE